MMLLPYPDLGRYRRPQLDWFRSRGVSDEALRGPPLVLVAHGVKAADGCFEDDAAGEAWLAFPEADDVTYWQPLTREFATWNRRIFAIGQDAIDNPATFTFDACLNVFADPLDWLMANRDGCVIVDWSQAFDRLRDAPRIAIAESLLTKYRRHMKPPTGPEIYVLKDRKAAA